MLRAMCWFTKIDHRPHVFLFNHDGVVRVRLTTFRGNVATGVVNKDINRPQNVCDFLNDAPDLFIVSQVSEHADSFYSVQLADLASCISERRPFAVLGRTVFTHTMNADVAAQVRQRFRERSSKPTS
jgi:hypothetical protein